ncbi:metal ABC transporter permease [Paenibacillus hunanensis]|uniref:Zinc transport system permease protein n=1 Tax=Paenibacillus hunanensis TaxID=539262 RepID=A0ABU1IU10_9BACL|nr:metal ABC transporter permease [Paenibacillus hunanensis]MCL9659958.1 metal ABC transporter permease [Paenibacillus hunanensis]MDR6242495.1 zinc transport system permease protein [Paenibacillus hunanensis]WPP39609.1 metal ABC transporter permease [Paenibacillus hunanensis]GGJ08241.1 high-affinity zinc uptake system membrane protein ZnuB [Paenibacillus hunanensis]
MGMFDYEFMQRAFWAGGMIAIIAPLLGVYLVLRRQVLMADTLSHVSLAGVAIGAIAGINPSVGGFLVAVLGALVIERLRQNFRGYGEVSIAVIMTGGLALALVLMSMDSGLNRSFSSYLFGSIVAVSTEQLWIIGAVFVIVLAFWVTMRRPLYNITFDEETAQIGGTHVRWLSQTFSVLTGMTVAAAMPIVGVLLVSALMALPAALSLRFARGFASALIMAVLIGLTGMFGGLTTSYYVNTPPGATVALLLLAFLLIGLGIQRILNRMRRGNDMLEGPDLDSRRFWQRQSGNAQKSKVQTEVLHKN